jgi:hypothetical protein
MMGQVLNIMKFKVRKDQDGEIIVQYLQTTTGRVILNYTIQNFKFFINKKVIY